MQIIVEKKGYRLLPLLAMAIVAALLLLVVQDTQAGHTDGVIELDVRTGGCPDPNGPAPPPATCGDANQINDMLAQTGDHDWVDICNTYAGEGLVAPTPPAVPQPFFANDIVVRGTQPAGVDVASCSRDYFKPDQTYFASEKDIIDVDAWDCVELNNPLNKNEILNTYAILGTPDSGPSAGDQTLYFGFERASNEGTAFMGFWFLQIPAACSHSGTGSTPFSGGAHVERCGIITNPLTCPDGLANPGDLLILVNYTGGGKIATVNVVAWDPGLDDCAPANIPSSQDPLCLIFTGTDCSDLPGADDTACAVVNTRNLSDPCTDATCHLLAPWNNACVKVGSNACASGTRTTLESNQFFEGNLNLDELVCGESEDPECEVPCLSTFIAETRSSDEFSATLKDYSRDNFDTCTSALTIQKEDEDGALLTGACYEITPTGKTAFTVCDDDFQAADVSDGDPTDGIVCVDGLRSNDYSIEEIVAPAGYIGDPVDKNVTISGPLTQNVDCPVALTGDADAVFVNSLGSLAWEKRSDIDGSLQTGASFTVSPNPFDCHQPAGTIESPILDNLGSDANTGDGQYLIEDVCLNSDGSARTYTITETASPSGFDPDPDSTRDCQVSAAAPDCEVGTEDVQDSCPDSVDGTDTDEEDFCNVVGSVYWEKRAKDASVTGDPLLPGATFEVSYDTTTLSVDDCTSMPCTGDDQDPDGGEFCVDGIPLDTEITITETDAPDNYVKDSTPKMITLTGSSSCDGTPTDAGDFFNTPLSEIEVIFTSLAGEGVTVASIECEDGSAATVPAVSENGAADPALDDTDEVFTDLEPDTYTCTIVVDP